MTTRAPPSDEMCIKECFPTESMNDVFLYGSVVFPCPVAINARKAKSCVRIPV